ncbi:MAG TPA: nuclear transport factor 2 family protein [Acidimicrobiales bacterium]|nr:nuclear transport factor 2 family protein [Acidimicrobiales bacterium]
MTSARDDELLETAEIRETLLRYAAGIDRRDWDLMLSCFTDDVWAIFQGNDLGRGRDKIRAYINNAASGFRIISSIHMLANMYIELDGARAKADTYGIGYLVFDSGSGPTLRTRHLHYIDDLVRDDDGSWLIAKRILTNDWERLTPVDPL